MTTPKPIETVYIEASGDPPAGIPRSSFTATVFVEREWAETVRSGFVDLYSDMCGERVAVMFDYELKAREEAMDRLAAEQEAP